MMVRNRLAIAAVSTPKKKLGRAVLASLVDVVDDLRASNFEITPLTKVNAGDSHFFGVLA